MGSRLYHTGDREGRLQVYRQQLARFSILLGQQHSLTKRASNRLLALNVVGLTPRISEPTLIQETAQQGLVIQEHWWLPLVAASSVILVAFLWQRWRLYKAHQHNRTLEALVEARTAELRKSSATYRRLVENLRGDYFFYTHDAQGRIIYLSPSMEQMLGYSHDEVIGAFYGDYLTGHPVNQGAAERLQQMLSGETLPPYELEFRHRDGTPRMLEIANVPMYDEHGMVIGVEGLVHDITARKQAEEEIRQLNEKLEQRVLERTSALQAAYELLQTSEERYRIFVEASYVGIWRAEYRVPVLVTAPIDQQYQQVLRGAYLAECNDAFAHMYGYESASEIIGEPLKTIFDLEAEGYINDFKAFIASGYQMYGSEIRNLDRYGVPHDLLFSTFSSIDGDRLIRSWGIQIDITERKQAEEALQQNRRMLEKAEELARFGSFEWDVASNHVTWSDELYRIYGVDPNSFSATLEAFLGYIHPEDQERIQEVVSSTLRFGQTYQTEERIVRADGEVRVLATVGEVIRDEDGTPLRIVGSCQDITEQKATEQALRDREAQYRALYEEVEQARLRLEHLSRRLVRVQEQERRRIALELHDEVGQLLTVLKLSLETVDVAQPEATRRTLDEAKAVIDTLADDVRALSLNLRPSMLDDLGLAPTLAWYMKRFTAQTNIQVDFQETGLARQRFDGDVETTVFRVIQEALTNVARYAGTDYVDVTVTIEPERLRFCIQDYGIGFDAEEALQAHETGGLSGIRERVGLLGGLVSITSRHNTGTSIEVELPL